VFEPLSIRSAGFGAPGLPGSIDQPRGHRANGLPLEPSPFSDNPLAIGPAGTVHLSLADWLKFVAAHLQARPGHPLGFTAETLQKLHSGEPFDESGRGYAMGWGVQQAPDTEHTFLFHDGSNTLWYASVWASPSERMAIVAVANQGGDAGKTACHEAIEAVRRSLEPATARLSRD
jgi:CubicO group peptidase (beta-lactamase class C family)